MRVKTSEDFRIAYKRLKKRHKSLQQDFERLLESLNVSDVFLCDIMKRME